MNTLQKIIFADLDEIFYSSDGFAESATYNGKSVMVLPDSGMMQSTSVPGYQAMGQQFRVRKSDVTRPKPGDKIIWSGSTWYVSGNPSLDGGEWLIDVTQETRNIGV